VLDRLGSDEAICLAGFRVPAGKPASQSAGFSMKFICLENAIDARGRWAAVSYQPCFHFQSGAKTIVTPVRV
jgi:hypothetical protein